MSPSAPRERDPRILASFRGADVADWPGEIRALEQAGIDGLHLDVMDGRWVNDKCFDANDLLTIREMGGRWLDVHLLVENPERVLEEFLAAKPDRLAFHVETAEEAGPLLERIREAGCQAGLVCLPSTPLDDLEPYLNLVDVVNPLGVDVVANRGFDESTFERIATLRSWKVDRGLGYAIQGDGGVWEKTRDAFVRAGAEELVGGYPIFSADDYAVAIAALRHGI